jgi:hypothetical protein
MSLVNQSWFDLGSTGDKAKALSATPTINNFHTNESLLPIDTSREQF